MPHCGTGCRPDLSCTRLCVCDRVRGCVCMFCVCAVSTSLCVPLQFDSGLVDVTMEIAAATSDAIVADTLVHLLANIAVSKSERR